MSAQIVFAVTIIAALVVNVLLTALIRGAAHRFHLFDRIDHRKTHQGEIPALGGIGIFVSFAVAGLVAVLVAHGDPRAVIFSWRYLSILVGAALMHVTGVVDDMIDIPAARKLLLQIAAAALVVSGGTALWSISLPFLPFPVPLGILALPLSVLWIVALSNALNLVDGIDGFAGGIALFAALAFGVIGLSRGDILVATIAGALAGAVLGFLVHNFPPARIFMGDGGSLFLGFALAVLAMMGSGNAGGVPVVIPIVLLAVPILDTFTAITRRTRRGLPIHAPDNNHFHHRLLRLTGSPRRTILYAYLLNGLCAIGAVTYALVGGIAGMLALVVTAVILLSVFVTVFRRVPSHYPRPGVVPEFEPEFEPELEPDGPLDREPEIPLPLKNAR
jgi:UDP-GlcNAc:undecaprenyl-phosphate/decaprenyl-phosphate GlcNAc-1-phosphate transferase